MEILLLIGGMMLLMYFLMILPQKRKMDQQRQLIEALQPGTRVMLSSGIFGTVRANGQNQMVVELAPGVEITVLKQAVVKKLTADEEEFEYEDDFDSDFPADALSAGEQPLAEIDNPIPEELAAEQFSTETETSDNLEQTAEEGFNLGEDRYAKGDFLLEENSPVEGEQDSKSS